MTGMALFMAMFHQSSQPSSLTRVSDGLIVDINDALIALIGYVREETVGKTTLELKLWDDADKRNAALAPLRDGESTLSLENTLTTKSGIPRVVHCRYTRFLKDGVPHLLTLMQEVTGSHESSQELQQKLDFIQKLTDRVPVTLFQYRLRPDGTSHFPYMSRGFGQMFGVSAHDVLLDATLAFKYVHPDDAATMREYLSASRRNLTPWQQVFRATAADGSQRWLSGDSMPQREADGSITWYGSMTDITARKLEEAQLAEARARVEQDAQALSAAMENMSDGFLTVDGNGKIARYNQRFLDLVEIEESVMQGFTHAGDLLEYQKERGDFGENFEWVQTTARPGLEAVTVERGPERYIRKTRNGHTLEIKTRGTPDGGVVRTYADVTHFVEAQAALHASEMRQRSLTALSSDWYWEQDENFRFVRVDGYAVENDVPSSAFVGLTRWETGVGGVSEAQWQAHRQALEAHQTFRNFEFHRTLKDGSVLWASISGAPILDTDGNFQGYRGIGRDITVRKQQEDEAQRLAFYDTLTGLPNRRLLLDRLGKALVVSGRGQTRGALLFIDLDNFKDLNDTMGHDVGDQLLEKVGNRLVTCIRQGDTVARFGGDEFVVMLEGLSADVAGAVSQVKTVGEKILDTLNLPFELSGKVHFSTPSVGVALFSGQHQSVDELLKRADLAMYQAKAAGRNTLRFFDPEMQAAVARRAAMELDMRQGMERDEFVLYYHAVMNSEAQISGVEALVRWHHPQRGRVPPGEFISVAEQSGLILALGHWVLKEACDQLVVWSTDARTRDISISVNISARQFRSTDFVANILGTLKQTGANPNLLKLELTESLLLTDVQEAIDKMTVLRASGVRFALDDFGTGYSSLSYLKRLPLDELKIDQSFVRDLLVDPNDAAIAFTVLALGLSLGLEVVAEGVETEQHRELLASKGCRYFQGYLYGQPVPVNELNLDSNRPGFASTERSTLF